MVKMYTVKMECQLRYVKNAFISDSFSVINSEYVRTIRNFKFICTYWVICTGCSIKNNPLRKLTYLVNGEFKLLKFANFIAKEHCLIF